VAAAVFAAQDAGDWSRLMTMLDPEALKDFKREQLELARMCEIPTTTSPEAVGPTEEAGDELRKATEAPWKLFRHLYKAQTASELESLPAASVVERFLRVKHRPHVRDGRPTDQVGTHRIIGEVLEGDRFAHVVFRQVFPIGQDPDVQSSGTAAIAPREWVDVLTLRRTPDGWRATLNGGLVSSVFQGWSIGFDPEAGEGD
jgi:hypothetical protein